MTSTVPTPEAIRAKLQTRDPAEERDLFAKARTLTEQRFNNRICLFAPLYVSDFCINNCLYCGFRQQNTALERRALSPEAVRTEAGAIVAMGHKTILIVAGEHPEQAGSEAIAQSIRAVKTFDAVRDIKVEVMPMSQEGYAELYAAGARTVVLYQETYDRALYAKAHPAGPKAAFAWRLSALERAFAAGFKRVGIGILVGLGEVAFEASMLIAHARSIHARWGIWPSTLSLPRLQPAETAPWSLKPPNPVDDATFSRLVALLRCELPEVGIALTTRESPELRDRLLELGVGITHFSAGSRTEVGGYATTAQDKSSPNPQRTSWEGQFSIQDERPALEISEQMRRLGHAPIWMESAACSDSTAS